MQERTIAASILAADFAYLANEVNAVLEAGVDYIHFDVMDHHFVPNLSFGALVCDALRKANIKAPIDVHLMVEHPEAYIEPFAKAGADLITFHPETVEDVEGLVDQINHLGMQAGLVFNPDKPVHLPLSLAKKLKMILLMSVYPGFGGQHFISEVLEKASQTRAWMNKHCLDLFLAIDGGVKTDNIAEIAESGVDYFVVGSGLFSATDYKKRVQELKPNLG